MAIKARGEFTVSVVNDGKGEKTFIRYSDDNGQTLTKAAKVVNIDYKNGANQVRYAQPYKSNGAGSKVSLFTTDELSELPLTTSVGYHVTAGGVNGGVFFYGTGQMPIYIGATGEDILLSCYMRSTTAGANVMVGVENIKTTAYISLTNDWKRYEVRSKADGNSHALIFYANAACQFDLCCIQFARGGGSDTWQPCPVDAELGTTQGKYIGIMSWDKPYPPLNPNAYTWSAFQGQDAELYKLSPLEESAIVGNEGTCKVTLRYNVTYIAGSKASKYTGDDITIKADSRLGALNFTKKATGEWECVTTIADFTTKNLGSFNVSVMKGAQVLDTRVIPVTYATQALLDANQKLGEVVASVRGVSKLIHNLLVGSTFLEPIDGVWSMAGAKVDDALKYNNSNVVFIEEHGATQDTYHSLLFNVSGLAPNTTYTISAMVRTDNLASFTGGNNGAVLEVTQTTNGQRKRLFDPISIVPLMANTWEKVEHTFTTPPTLTSEVVEVKFMLLRNGRLWVSQPMMNQGNVAADYTANIKDIQLSLAQIKLTANTISQTVTDLSTGIEQAGIHLDGANSEITLKADKTKFVDRDGETDVFIKDGKLNAKAINADKVIADGIQGKTIDAKDATFENVNVKGTLKGVSGSFSSLDCEDIYGKVVGSLGFDNHQNLTITNGDLKMEGKKEGRKVIFNAENIWCRGRFSASARCTAVVLGERVKYYCNWGDPVEAYIPATHEWGTNRKIINLLCSFTNGMNSRYGRNYPIGLEDASIDTIIFAIPPGETYYYNICMEETQRVTIINAHDDANNVFVYLTDGQPKVINGGVCCQLIKLPIDYMTPIPRNAYAYGVGVVLMGETDNNWT